PHELKGINRYTPASFFPRLNPKDRPDITDDLGKPELEYYYIIGTDRLSMKWGNTAKSWSRSFMGRKSGAQPERTVYLRTLANMTNPSEVRSILQLGRKPFSETNLDAGQIALAHRLLPFQYQSIKHLALQGKELLVAARDDTMYSEFHMSSGERAVLHLSKDVSRLHGALILIDEVEVGLHPYLQRQLMLELQRLALRNNLQIMVTSHSSVILDSVPPEARIFLERREGEITKVAAYRDILQQSLYGQVHDRLSILCEDTVAEQMIWGVLDVLLPEMQLNPASIHCSRDTGKSQFPQHVDTLGMSGLLDQFLFVLDGDGREIEAKIKERGKAFQRSIQPLYLPGDQCPEDWLYRELESKTESYQAELNMVRLAEELQLCRQQFDSASDTPANIAKYRWEALCDRFQRDGLVREVARYSAKKGDLQGFYFELRDALESWRSMGS
ncbi:MAG: AAA family ATPase, partial [Spirochaetota bacterium]